MIASVLIVEDEFIIAEDLAYMANDIGLNVCGIADTAERAVEMAKEHRPTLIFMDVRLRGKKDGVDAALEIWATLKSPVIYITGSQEPATLERISTDHPAAILFKPFNLEHLKRTVTDILSSIRDEK